MTCRLLKLSRLSRCGSRDCDNDDNDDDDAADDDKLDDRFIRHSTDLANSAVTFGGCHYNTFNNK